MSIIKLELYKFGASTTDFGLKKNSFSGNTTNSKGEQIIRD